MAKANKKSSNLPVEPEAEEWDFSEGFGILPSDIPLTQNIGCVGKPKKNESNPSEKKK